MKQYQNSSPIFLISGIEPSKKGAGKFLEFFINTLKANNENIIINYIRTPENRVIKLLKKFWFSKILKELFYFINRNVFSKSEIKNSTIILFHPQSLGLKNSIKLIENNKKIFYYVLDNFFFCKKSYNHLPNTNKECVLCIEDLNSSVNKNCPSFPNSYNHPEYLEFIKCFKNNSSKIHFLTQNENQTQLLKNALGDNINVKKIGMYTGELNIKSNPSLSMDFEYDFFYHNTLSEAKGIKYFIDLCKNLPQYKFVIPYSESEVEKFAGCCNLQNLFFFPCTWDNGLLDLMIKSKITIVPSLWSAPIEGSVLKSLFYSNAVGIIPQVYSFSSEIPSKIIITLDTDIQSASQLLSESIYNNISLNRVARIWLQEFIISNIDSLDDFSRHIDQN